MAEEQVCSPSMRKYFQEIETEVTRSYKLANQARALNLDPEDRVDIIRTQNMAERVAGLISIVAPQLLHTNLAERIPELEKEYGKLDWRVGFKVAEEVAKESFCKFSSKEEAMEVAIRVGFAYLTLGIVSAPLEGFVSLKIKKRLDNGQPYFSLNYAGPVRGAGGTAAATSVLLSDYIRVKMGYAEYDPTEEEVKRFATEIHDYHERVTNLQYHPSTEEIEFLARHVPVEINGDPTEKFEVSQHKDIPRIETNRIRGGICLVMAEGIAQKAPKLWKRLSVWGKEMGVNWEFLAEFLELQKQIKAKREVKKEAKSEEKLTPNFTFIKDLVAGRPILTYPMREGGFRLRYGRSRLSGFSALGLNPATMQILDKFIAIGTQLKIERPGKAGVVSLCDTIDGPIVKLKNGSVVYLATPAEAKIVNDSVEEIIFLGDILFNYGDFSENGHKLIPAGYCPEWWIQEVEKSAKEKFSEEIWFNLSSQTGIAENRLKELKENFLTVFPSVEEAGKLSIFLNVPLHSAYTYHWRRLSLERLKQLFIWLKQATLEYQDDQTKVVKKIILPWKKEEHGAVKESLELIGMPHKVSIEFIILENEVAQTLSLLFNLKEIKDLERIILPETAANALEAINAISSVKMKDKSGTFIGARMGRPEKAKMRKMDGSPQALFPVGEEGDRMRSFQSALAAGKVTADFPLLYCQKCKKNTVYLRCEICGEKPLQKYHCKFCGDLSKEQCQHGPARNFSKITIDIKHYFDLAMKQTETKMAPDLIKGVRGTSNKNHFVENLAKGLLRAKHNLYVNKDGTIRYDCTEMPLTHFKPIEVNTSVEKLKELGYETDIHDMPLETADQILELKPQDVILPGFNSLDESAIQVMFRTAKFVDELLVKIYHQPPFYNLKNEGDLIGHLVIGLAPHISAGLMGRIIGFSETQGLLAHPLWHAGLRRDCDGDEAAILMLMDGLLNFSRQFLPNQRGGRTMDAPLVLTSIINPSEVDDQAQGIDVVWKYPLEFYEAALQYKPTSEVRIAQIKHSIGKETQFEKMGFIHQTNNLNAGINCSSYKTIPSMMEKLRGQMELARRIRAVDTMDVANMVIQKHFLKDIRGNLRQFSQQQFRCTKCDTKYRRPPLLGRCSCGNNLIFTVTEGSIVKYLGPSMMLAKDYGLSDYLKQNLELTHRYVESIFGKDKDKQEGLGKWFGG